MTDLVCANCRKSIEKEYYRCLDNFLQVKYFDEQDGSDNIFCSQECFCEALSVECVLIQAASQAI